MARTTRVDPSIAGQAADWWARLHDEGASPEDQRQFGLWVVRSPERIEAYLDVARLMRGLKSDRIRWPSTPADELIRMAKAAPGDPVPMPGISSPPERMDSLQDDVTEAPANRGRSLKDQGGDQNYRRYGWALAACALLAMASAWLWLQKPQEYATKFGEQRSILLSDGSRVTLNTASGVEVKFQKDRRIVHLLKGEALFDVAHDSSRPFDVIARTSVLRAVGTEFNIDLGAKDTTLTVVEGRVAVMREAEAKIPINSEPSIPETQLSPSEQSFPAPPGSLILAAAERVVITAAGPGVPQHVSNLAATTSWTKHQLVFDHEPLAEVAEQFSRYNHGQIVIEGPDLARREITGVFQADDPNSFLTFLAEIPGVQIRAGKDGSHVVTRNAVQEN